MNYTPTILDSQKTLPTSISDERFEAFLEILNFLSETNLKVLDIYDIDSVTTAVLSHLADYFDVMGYFGWFLTETDEQRRTLIKESIRLHKYMGTPHGIKRILKLFGFESSQLIENPCGIYDGGVNNDGVESCSPYYTCSPLLESNCNGELTFTPDRLWAGFLLKLDLSKRGIPDKKTYSFMIKFLQYWKNARSHLLGISGIINIAETQTLGDYLCRTIYKILRCNSPASLHFDASAIITLNGKYTSNNVIKYYDANRWSLNFGAYCNGGYKLALFDGFWYNNLLQNKYTSCDDFHIPWFDDIYHYTPEDVSVLLSGDTWGVFDGKLHLSRLQGQSLGIAPFFPIYLDGGINKYLTNNNLKLNHKVDCNSYTFFADQDILTNPLAITFAGGSVVVAYTGISVESAVSQSKTTTTWMLGTINPYKATSYSIVTPSQARIIPNIVTVNAASGSATTNLAFTGGGNLPVSAISGLATTLTTFKFVIGVNNSTSGSTTTNVAFTGGRNNPVNAASGSAATGTLIFPPIAAANNSSGSTTTNVAFTGGSNVPANAASGDTTTNVTFIGGGNHPVNAASGSVAGTSSVQYQIIPANGASGSATPNMTLARVNYNAAPMGLSFNVTVVGSATLVNGS